MFKGQANGEETKAFLKKHDVNPDQQRSFCGVFVSSLALGTYLGQMDEITDAKVTGSALKSWERGCNFVDAAINYRGQRAERSMGDAIRRGILSGAIKREEIFISTKGGFVPFEGALSQDMKTLFHQQYVSRGIAESRDLISDCHCMEPRYLENQIERSRKNLQLETIDLYYLHNPETQLEELPERIFYDKLEKAFETLEQAVKKGFIGAYGLATWNGLRDEETAQTFISLEKCVQVAEKVSQSMGLEGHHFKAIQLPLNLAMPEAALLENQKVNGISLCAIDAATALGLGVAVSVPLFQSKLCHGLPGFLVESFPKEFSQAHCALAFATGFSSVSAAMVGMKAPEHVSHNLEFLKKTRLSSENMQSVIKVMIH